MHRSSQEAKFEPILFRLVTQRKSDPHSNVLWAAGAQGRNRTTDTVIFSHVLYQLSYLGAARHRRERKERV
jgi:hypothetical protein